MCPDLVGTLKDWGPWRGSGKGGSSKESSTPAGGGTPQEGGYPGGTRSLVIHTGSP